MSKFIKLTNIRGNDVYISEVSSIGVGDHGETEITTQSGVTYSVIEKPSEILEWQMKFKSSEVKTIRDEFAMAALTGLTKDIHGTGETLANDLAKSAYKIADAMIKERSK